MIDEVSKLLNKIILSQITNQISHFNSFDLTYIYVIYKKQDDDEHHDHFYSPSSNLHYET